MIVTQNTIKNTSLSIASEKQEFTLEAETMPFHEVKSISHDFTECYEDGVYLGKRLNVRIEFHHRETFSAKVDSRYNYDYARLYYLVYALENHIKRYQKQGVETECSKRFEGVRPTTGSDRLIFIFCIVFALLFVLFAINGWFDLYGMDIIWIAIPSIISSILLPVKMMVFALRFLWLKPRERKIKERESFLEKQAALGLLPKPPQKKVWLIIACFLSPFLYIGIVALLAIIFIESA